jgi:hypothetical protein
MRQSERLVAIIFSLVVCGCATTTVRNAESVEIAWTTPEHKVVLIEPDIELSELTAGGVTEPRADWTETARSLIDAHLQNTLSERQAQLVNAQALTDPHEIQIARLHSAVGLSILTHLYLPNYELPNKGDALDWTLGSGANVMQTNYSADYGLFVYIRDSYSTTGRALMMVGAALFGVAVQGGTRVGFASLVDLRTGNIVWFNRIANATGDLTTAEPATRTMDTLLEGLPL